MGLDATVYKNKASLNLGNDIGKANIDPETGQVYFDDPVIERSYPNDYFEAATFRLGNVAAIDALREEVASLVNDGFIGEKILYSGTHAGDFIPLDELPLLEREIKLLRAKTRASRDLLEFLQKLDILVDAAKENGTPIVF
jgi:hypothetical protein